MKGQYTVKALGAVVCVIGAVTMAAGDAVVGADHTSMATIVGIVGLGIIARARRMKP